MRKSGLIKPFGLSVSLNSTLPEPPKTYLETIGSPQILDPPKTYLQDLGLSAELPNPGKVFTRLKKPDQMEIFDVYFKKEIPRSIDTFYEGNKQVCTTKNVKVSKYDTKILKQYKITKNGTLSKDELDAFHKEVINEAYYQIKAYDILKGIVVRGKQIITPQLYSFYYDGPDAQLCMEYIEFTDVVVDKETKELIMNELEKFSIYHNDYNEGNIKYVNENTIVLLDWGAASNMWEDKKGGKTKKNKKKLKKTKNKRV